jgi:hypothetical protein
MGLVSQFGWYTSLMKPVSKSLAISLFITSFLSWVKWQSHCLMGLAFGSVGFHAKMSLFLWRNLMSTSSYLGSRLLPT